ncbi:hypothetical protein [Roseovarius sp. M141]|uniref:hypothetical protein n=1 Tax=Roseovarius sp. M141 TaxID=2583806 RepID=UPI0020CDAF98|nr:hypothetical protein [Roseovarius sp. M141]MCQ0090611.1 hypothetical protein [Roseovarius sp. M141]
MGRHTVMETKGLSKAMRLMLHLLVLIALVAASIGLATFLGGLWPFDLRFSALIAASGLAVQAIAWWPAALAFVVIAALLPRTGLRLAVWPLAVLGMAVLHAVFGPDLGFAPLGVLGLADVLELYAIPTALPILAGSALREAFSGNPEPRSAAHMPSPERSSP